MRQRALSAVSVLLASACVFASSHGNTDARPELGIDADAMPVEMTDVEGVERTLYRDGRVFISGQPSEEALAAFKGFGVTAVVNLRTPGEMEDREKVAFDEAAAVEKLEMEYIFIPLGGKEHPYTAEALDRFAEVMREHEGRVLVHCTMGWRASYMWVAYLVREHGFALDDAMARGEAVAISPAPLQGLLGKELRLAYE